LSASEASVSGSRQTESVVTALAYAQAHLRQAQLSSHSENDIRADARALVRLATGCSDADIYAHPDKLIEPDAMLRLEAFVIRRSAGEPFAYIEGSRGFHAIELAVDPNVLIPRPETELIVDAVIGRAPVEDVFSLVDLGTGSGAIALAVAKARRNAHVAGVDVSAAALSVARANGRRLGLGVEWIESDWFSGLTRRRFDFLCCNPPYVRSDDPHLQCLGHEPLLALDGGDDGLESIRHVLHACTSHLSDGGTVLLEHGYDQAAEVRRIGIVAGLQPAEILRDPAGHERVSVFRARSRR
jgi:release factor glutamine methyltransferase